MTLWLRWNLLQAIRQCCECMNSNPVFTVMEQWPEVCVSAFCELQWD